MKIEPWLLPSSTTSMVAVPPRTGSCPLHPNKGQLIQSKAGLSHPPLEHT